MNLVGEIGNFMMVYQTPIQGVVIVMLLAGGVVAAVKVIANARKKQKLLEDISQTVSEINTNVKALGEIKTEVVYIDGNVAPERDVPPVAVEEKTQPAPQEEKAEIPKQECNRSLAEEVKPAVKYFSRDCAIAKDGRKYTVEELNAQIRD